MGPKPAFGRPAGGRDEFGRLLARTVRYVQAGVRSRRDVAAYLARCRIAPRLAARLLAACERRGLIDDGAAARLLADHWARRGYAWAAIRQRLTAKGFAHEVIARAGAAVGGAEGDEARALELLAQRRRRRTLPPPARLARALASRGFESELIGRIVKDACGSPPSDAER